MLSLLDDHPLIVTDLKQYTYCPRVVYFERCLADVRPTTYKMEAGADEHERERKRAARRSLAAYGVSDGTRQFDVVVESTAYMLRGLIDEVVTTASGGMFPVDYKQAKKVSANHRAQLCAYALLLEAMYGVTIQRGFIYLIGKREAVEVKFTKNLRGRTQSKLEAMAHMVRHETMPPPTTTQSRCFSCEFRRFCNDVY